MTKFTIIFIITIFTFSCQTNKDNKELSDTEKVVKNKTDNKAIFYFGDSALTINFRAEHIGLEEYEKTKIVNGEKITSETIGDTILINLYKELGAVYYKGACQINGDTLVLNYWPITETEVSLATFYKFIYKIRKVDYKYKISKGRTNPYLYK